MMMMMMMNKCKVKTKQERKEGRKESKRKLYRVCKNTEWYKSRGRRIKGMELLEQTARFKELGAISTTESLCYRTETGPFV